MFKNTPLLLVNVRIKRNCKYMRCICRKVKNLYRASYNSSSIISLKFLELGKIMGITKSCCGQFFTQVILAITIQ